MDQYTFIGMDLGSFKTSVTSSNGRRGVVQSAVGWPKDHVAKAMLGRDIVFGEETHKQRLALNVVRPFEKGALKFIGSDEAGLEPAELEKHKEAAKLLVEHAVSLTMPDKDKPIYGVIGAPSRASITNKQILLDAAEATFDAVIIVAEPFTVAYGMDRLSDTLVVDIGAGTIDICPMYGTYPTEEDQLTIPIGGDKVDEELHRRIRETYPEAQLSLNMARGIKEKYGFVHDVNESAVVSLPVDGKPQDFDVTESLKEACKSIVEPIIDGIRNLIAKFDPEFQRRMLQSIILGGGGSQLNGLGQLIEKSLEPYGGGNVTRVYDSVFAGAVGALKLALSMPKEHWDNVQAADKNIRIAA